ncbi:hypothetical protein CEUSTIGMA_g10107.t1 [Chlamydomonas eustigma]|uniref:Uncharacterized protein n=1 Tax=Chlamydomonas eustigma TaxID=1157962 RepID=A0A250XHX6_9CHLO|nr:hypothetical protein CEUSTIGMA_g10107.t1 [Chlamydomonas eustigma]|eukprot:GAX82681.1 hypothetical protein CEUSTIGMA_g10107.t1 [Chlamydomonas eustigma]
MFELRQQQQQHGPGLPVQVLKEVIVDRASSVSSNLNDKAHPPEPALHAVRYGPGNPFAGGINLNIYSGVTSDDTVDSNDSSGYTSDEEEAVEEVDEEEGLDSDETMTKLKQTLEELREQLSEQKSVCSGLRGELRKYTDVHGKLHLQIRDLMSQAVKDQHPEPSVGRGSTHTSTSFQDQVISQSQLPVAPSKVDSSSAFLASQLPSSKAFGLPLSQNNPFMKLWNQGDHGSAGPAPATEVTPVVTPVTTHPHTALPGLEMDKRLELYRDMIKAARSVGCESREVEDCEEVLQGKEALDPGSEKVVLIKLQRMLIAGMEAERKLKLQVGVLMFALFLGYLMLEFDAVHSVL